MISFVERIRDEFNSQLARLKSAEGDLATTDGVATTAAANASTALSELTGKADKAEITASALKTLLRVGGNSLNDVANYQQVRDAAPSTFDRVPTTADLANYRTGIDTTTGKFYVRMFGNIIDVGISRAELDQAISEIPSDGSTATDTDFLAAYLGTSEPTNGTGGNTGGGTPAPTGIVFQTDFAADLASSYREQDVNGWNAGSAIPPVGFQAVRAAGPAAFVEAVTDDGAAAMALNYRQESGRSSITMARNLTGDPTVGYDELYIRYNLKLPANFKAGTNGRNLPFWKWGRLWQNTSPVIGASWTEQRVDSGYAVWGLLSGWQGNQGFQGAFSDNTIPGNHTAGSNGGPIQYATWYRAVPDPKTADGFWEAVGNGAWNLESGDTGFLANRTQTYHTIEWRFKLATSAAAEDGAFEIWIDGDPIIPFTQLSGSYGAPTRTGIPTTRIGSGWNHFSLFDNMDSWAPDWGQSNVDGYILVRDVVVSTDRIGHDYVASGTTPVITP